MSSALPCCWLIPIDAWGTLYLPEPWLLTPSSVPKVVLFSSPECPRYFAPTVVSRHTARFLHSLLENIGLSGSLHRHLAAKVSTEMPAQAHLSPVGSFTTISILAQDMRKDNLFPGGQIVDKAKIALLPDFFSTYLVSFFTLRICIPDIESVSLILCILSYAFMGRKVKLHISYCCSM